MYAPNVQKVQCTPRKRYNLLIQCLFQTLPGPVDVYRLLPLPVLAPSSQDCSKNDVTLGEFLVLAGRKKGQITPYVHKYPLAVEYILWDV